MSDNTKDLRELIHLTSQDDHAASNEKLQEILANKVKSRYDSALDKVKGEVSED